MANTDKLPSYQQKQIAGLVPSVYSEAYRRWKAQPSPENASGHSLYCAQQAPIEGFEVSVSRDGRKTLIDKRRKRRA